ncbi:MAG: hypothetical protein EXR77_08880 [Myxococcales bacterium]|nr:hypothetical protein [Myxococcales bacterium]
MAKSNFDDGDSSAVLVDDGLVLPPTAAKLAFWLYQDTEKSDAYDLFEVRINGKIVLQPNGSAEFLMATSQLWTIELAAFAGTTVKLEFWFDTGDKVDNTGLGVISDDIVVGVSCK